MRKAYYATLLFLSILIFKLPLYAQVAAKLDINNISSGILTHGDMWWDPTTGSPSCEFYKGSGLSISLAGSLWMGCVDAAGKLHVAAQTYRQKGNDYWPGPLNSSDTLTAAVSNQWDKVWKIDYRQIDSFKSVSTHTLTNTPTAILEWPAKGNSYAKGVAGASLSISQDMAPFVDVNGNGTYEPLSGDYPILKGDQMLWWVFSDNGPTHNETGALPLKVEVHASAYAYNRPGMLKNIQYYEYDVINKGITYNNFRMGMWSDMDLGYSFDDYIGFDSTHRMGYIYNSETPDRSLSGYGYGSSMPIAGISVIEMPNDGASLTPAGSFMYFNNDFGANGNPSNDTEYYRYLNATFRKGQHLVNDFTGYGKNSFGVGTGPLANYVFPGNPADTSQWSECASKNIGGDRRFIIGSGDYTFPANQHAKYIFALVVTDTSADNYCPHADITKLKQMADSSWHYFNNPSSVPTGVANITTARPLEIYPNPAHNILNIKNSTFSLQNLQVIDVLGRTMNVDISKSASGISIDINKLNPGIYTLIYHSATGTQTALFIKQ